MRVCLNCGKNIRDGADFCTACGAPAPAPEPTPQATPNSEDSTSASAGSTRSETVQFSTDVPLITLAPERTPMSKQRLIRTGKLMLGVTTVILLVIAGLFAAAYLKTDPFKENPFQESSEALDDESYRKCLSLVNDVRNDNFDQLINDILQMSGDFEDYNFLTVYEQLFKDIVPDDSEDKMAIKFRNCCFMVAYTEFTAKKYESYTDGFLGSMYVNDADMYRRHADKLWEDLNNAQSEAHLDSIIAYCRDNNIIFLKDSES